MKKNLFTLKSTRSSKQKRKISQLQKDRPLIIEPYITEKSFNLIEKENKLTFIVDEQADKKSIKQELHDLYESKSLNFAKAFFPSIVFAVLTSIISAS